MRIVATGAGNFAFAIGHVRRALQLRPPHLVALQAQFRLRFLGAYVFGEGRAVARVCRSQSCIPFSGAAVVNLMAVHAGHGPRLVRAAPPEHLIALGVAGQASRISFLDRGGGILGEADRDRIFAAARFHVGLAWSVASFAAELLQRGLWDGPWHCP